LAQAINSFPGSSCTAELRVPNYVSLQQGAKEKLDDSCFRDAHPG